MQPRLSGLECCSSRLSLRNMSRWIYFSYHLTFGNFVIEINRHSQDLTGNLRSNCDR